MAKSDRFYFENFTAAAECCVTAAKYLEECLKNFDSGKIQDMIAQMHEYENRADAKKHEMTAELARAFVTPLDREDLAEISGKIDDVADMIEEVLQRFYMDRIKTVYPEAIEFAEKIVKCCELMKNLLSELANFKKPQSFFTAVTLTPSALIAAYAQTTISATIRVRNMQVITVGILSEYVSAL